MDLLQGLLQLAGQRLGLAPLGRDLAGVGEVGVVVEPGPAVVEPELRQLGLELRLLQLEQVAVVGGGGVGRGIARHPGNAYPPPTPPARGWARW